MAPLVIMSTLQLGTTMHATQQQKSALNKAGDEAKRLANLNAADIEAETAEEARRLKMTQEGEESLALARAAASGGDVKGSTSNMFLSALSTENKKQLEWLKRSGLSAATTTREGGASAKRTSSSQASAAGAQGLATATGQVGGYANKWYQNKKAA